MSEVTDPKLPARKGDTPWPKAMPDALRRGDLKALVDLLIGDLPAGEPTEREKALRTGAERLGSLAIELRRNNVAVIGNHEAFVRHTSQGDIEQVIRPVRLSTADKTLYQMTKNVMFKKGTNEQFYGSYKENKNSVEWRAVPIVKGVAELTYQGYVRVNAVAGCAVIQPSTVVVDGEKRTNPYVERAKGINGRLGDIQRIVVGIAVVGPTPATGTPTCVTYTLDYDPAKDLLHMLGDLAADEKAGGCCHLVMEDEPREKGWGYTPLYGGMGFTYNLRSPEVLDVMQKFVNILENAMKKASTVARRNAMRNHPALGVQTVAVDDNNMATIPVVGWAGARDVSDKWEALMARLARGEVAAEIEQVAYEDKYDPVRHGGAEGEKPREKAIDADVAPAIPPEQEERNRLVQQIDEGIGVLKPSQVKDLNYNPAAPLEELRAVLAKMNALADAS